MITLTLLLLAAAIAHIFSSLLRVSAIPVLIISGIVLSAIGIIDNMKEVEHTLLLGLTFLMFIAGTELNPERSHLQLNTSIRVGVFQFAILGLSGYLMGRIFLLDNIPSLYMGLAVAASSTLLVLKILQMRRQVYESFGRLVLGVLLVQDLIAILFIALLSTNELTPISVFANLLAISFIFFLSWTFQRFLAPFLFVHLKLDEETLLIVSLSVLFAFTFLSNALAIHFVVGAFFAGFALSSFPIHGIVRSQLISLSDFFVAIFFVSLGTTLVIPSERYLVLAITMIALVVLATPLIVLVIAERSGLTTRGAFQAGLLLAQTSELSIVIGIIGHSSGHISQELYSVIALITVASMILTPLIATDELAWKLTKLRPFRKFGSQQTAMKEHIVFLGFGRSVQVLVDSLDQNVLKNVMIIDHDPGALKKLDNTNIQYTRGDAADFRVLDSCGAKNARLVISTLNNVTDNQNIAGYLRNVPMVVRVHEDFEANIILGSGATPVLSSRLASEDTIRWIKEYF